jgi:hypothetical protein
VTAVVLGAVEVATGGDGAAVHADSRTDASIAVIIPFDGRFRMG